MLLFDRGKKSYFKNINFDIIVDHKPFFPTKIDVKSYSNRNDEIISDELKEAETFNDYFINIVPSLKSKL